MRTTPIGIAAMIAALAPWVCAAGTGSPAARPNVILIVTDDQGCGDFSIAGNPVLRTPNLDALATAGMRMPRFYVSPVCTTTPACLMTGRYNYRTRAIDTYIGRAMMDPAEVTLAEALRGAGYATGIFGKWHLGDNYPMRAMDQGFEESLVLRGGGIGQPSDPPGGEGKYTDPILFHNGRPVPMKGYCTDIYFEAAMEWMQKNVREGKRFFAYIPTNAPHSPFHDVPRELYEKYRKVDWSPVVVGPPNARKSREENDTLARIFAMISNIDENIGRLTQKLRDLGVLDNTIILFFNDNGPNTARYVGPLRGTKADVHEGGIRAAFFARWSAAIRPGSTCDVPAAHIDVMPTILEACGVRAPEGVRLDGRSILPLLTGSPVKWPDREIFLQTHRGDRPILYHHFAVVTERWKLLNASGFEKEEYAGPPRFELYDLLQDPGERNNLAAEHPEIVERLRQDYEKWFKDVGSTRPDNYAPPRIYIGAPQENPVTLTRQDWRRGPGERKGYGATGVWLLHVARPGRYEVRLRFPAAAEADGTAALHVAGEVYMMPFRQGDAECMFGDVPLQPGDVDLWAMIETGQKKQGPWQVDVRGPS